MGFECAQRWATHLWAHWVPTQALLIVRQGKLKFLSASSIVGHLGDLGGKSADQDLTFAVAILSGGPKSEQRWKGWSSAALAPPSLSWDAARRCLHWRGQPGPADGRRDETYCSYLEHAQPGRHKPPKKSSGRQNWSTHAGASLSLRGCGQRPLLLLLFGV